MANKKAPRVGVGLLAEQYSHLCRVTFEFVEQTLYEIKTGYDAGRHTAT